MSTPEEALLGGRYLPFRAKVTARTNSSGTFLYDWSEQHFEADGTTSAAANPGREGTSTEHAAYELNNRQVAVNTYVWMRQRWAVGGEPTFEFMSPEGSLAAYSYSGTTFSYTNVTETHTNTTASYTGGSTAWTNSSVTSTNTAWSFNTSSSVTFANTSSVAFNSGSTLNLQASSTFVMGGPTWNVTANTTTTLSNNVIWTVTGGDLVTYATFLEVCGYLSWCTRTVTQWTANQDDWAYPDTGVVYRVSTDATRSLTGVVARTVGGTAKPQLAYFVNVGSNNVVLKHQTTSSAANQLSLPGSVDHTLPPGGAVGLWYDTTASKWKMLAGATPATTKGDLVTFTGTAHTRRAVGTDGHVLTADSSTSDGVKWAAASAGTPPGGDNGTSALGSPYTVTSSWATTGLSVTLPAAGTYLLCYNAYALMNTSGAGGGIIHTRLYDSTNAAAVTASIRYPTRTTSGGADFWGNASAAVTYTVTGSATVRLEAQYVSTPAVTTATVVATEGTVLSYVRIDD